MRAKPSTTATGIYSSTGTLTTLTPPPVAMTAAPRRRSLSRVDGGATVSIAQGAGLLHDTQNLMSAIGLYCDLLSLPDVLKPQHRHYADELRLLGARSEALMQRMMGSLLAPEGDASIHSQEHLAGRIGISSRATGNCASAQPVSLREIVVRSTGLLSQVAGGRLIEVIYGPAASAPVLVEEETVERILVNLVRNSAAALDTVTDERESSAGIRIEVGLVPDLTGDSRPWPFPRVTLAVEDSGCGMTSGQLDRVLRAKARRPQNPHGLGLRVVQELVAAAAGDLRITSTPGVGTLVRIAWPIATASLTAVEPKHGVACRSRTADTVAQSQQTTDAGAGRIAC